jgi:hypothetical protein
MKIHNCEQGSAEWHALRCGIPTASEFGKLITPLGKPRKGEGRESYILEKLADKLMGYSKDSLNAFAVDQGQIVEKIARPWYECLYDVKVQQVGFCTTNDSRIGCSPDGLIGEDGGIEIKSPQPPAHLEYLLAGVVPPDYVAQVQGSLFVTGRKWWKFVSFSRHFPALVLHVEPIPAFQDALREALAQFTADFDDKLARIQELTKGTA